MIRFVKDQRPEGRDIVMSQLLENVDRIGDALNIRQVFDPGYSDGPKPSQSGSASDKVNPASGDFVETSEIPDAKVVDAPPNYSPSGETQCLYYPDSDYAICGYSDPDPMVPFEVSCSDDVNNRLPPGTVGFSTKQEAEQALALYGYAPLNIFAQLAGFGTYSKGYSEAGKFRWQAEIYQDKNTGKFCIWTDGPEPDPIFFWAFSGGLVAVQDWHSKY